MNECIFKNVEKKEMKKLKRHFLLPLRNVIYGYQLTDEFGKKKKNFVYGNFANYYYERYKKGKNEHEKTNEKEPDNSNSYIQTNYCLNKKNKKEYLLDDARLKKINKLIKNIFKKKIILDIGCNIGVTTFLLSLKYKCKIVNGVDIDCSLINKNIHLLKLFVEFVLLYNEQRHMVPFFLNHKKLLQIEKNLFVDLFELYEQTKENACIKKQEKAEEKKSENKNEKQKSDNNKNNNKQEDKENKKENEQQNEYHHFPFNIYFMCANIFDKAFEKTENKYDVIICFSVLKWVHLNYGDDSLILFFDIIYKLLKAKGYFILEYHNEIKYKLRKSEKKFYRRDIQLNYNDFKNILCRMNEKHCCRMELIYKVDSFHSENNNEKTEQKEKEREKKRKKRGMFNRTICIYQKN